MSCPRRGSPPSPMRENVEKHKYSGALSIMFKNAFTNLQKAGKSLMLPVSVLPIAGRVSVPLTSAGCQPLYRTLWQKRADLFLPICR